EVDTFLDLVIDHGPKLRWSTLIGNHNPARVAHNLNNPCAIIGFSDAGAHLRNMAFYNFGLALLQLAVQDAPVMTPEKAVWRLTGEIAEWYGLDIGVLKVGAQADLVLLDPEALKRTRLDGYAEAPFEAMGGLQRVVNRNDGVIKYTLIRGQVAFENDMPSPALGKQVMGRFLARGKKA
ncbi:MAG: amidohydrolase family protein, partial [Pseudoxanthomonas sp.]